MLYTVITAPTFEFNMIPTLVEPIPTPSRMPIDLHRLDTNFYTKNVAIIGS